MKTQEDELVEKLGGSLGHKIDLDEALSTAELTNESGEIIKTVDNELRAYDPDTGTYRVLDYLDDYDGEPSAEELNLGVATGELWNGGTV